MRSKHAHALATLFCLTLVNARPCSGIDYSFQADAMLKQTYDSNILLSPKAFNPEAVWGSDMDLRTSFTTSDPIWTAGIGARFDNWFYAPVSGLDMQNQYLDGHYSYATEHSRWKLTGSYISDANMSSHVDNTRTDQNIQGIIFGRVQRESKNISPSWNYSFDEYTRLELSYSYNESKYASSPTAIYPSSTSQSLSSSLNHQASENLALTGTLSATNYTTSQRSTIDYLNFMLGFEYTPREDIKVSISGGEQYSQSTTLLRHRRLISKPPFIITSESKQASDSFIPLYSISLRKTFEKSSLTLAYSSQSSPTINGSLFTSDSASVGATHRFSQRIDLGLGISYSTISNPSQNGSVLSQDSYQLNADLSYSLAENCAIHATYNYILRDLGAATGGYEGIRDSHGVSLSLSYNFEKLHY